MTSGGRDSLGGRRPPLPDWLETWFQSCLDTEAIRKRDAALARINHTTPDDETRTWRLVRGVRRAAPRRNGTSLGTPHNTAPKEQ